MTSVRSWVLAAVALAVVLLGLPEAVARASSAAEPVLVIDGRGNGHGVGLSQDGALAMGEAGAGTDEILAKFYPGTELATAGGVLRVRVLESAATRVDVSFPGGGEVRASREGPQPEGFPVTVRAGGTATISVEGGSFHAESQDGEALEVAMPAVRLIVDDPTAPPPIAQGDPTTSTTTVETTTTTIEDQSTTTTIEATAPTTVVADVPATPAPTTPAPTTPTTARSGTEASSPDGVWLVPTDGSTTTLPLRGRQYRGVMEAGRSTVGGLSLVNHLDVEEYLRGMGEVLDPSWPQSSLQAQAIAARTYALRATRAGGTLCDDDRCQVYLGAGAEYPAMDKAVGDSAGRVLAFGGGLASTVYSASAGGVTATPREGFGTDGSDYPYLTSAPYPASDPPVWSTTVALSDLGRRLEYPGRVREAAVSAEGPSGRALEVVLEGDAGQRVVDGLRFASRLDLDSTLFSLRTAIGTPSAPPRPGQGSIQASPDDAALLPPLLEPSPLAIAGPKGLDVAHVGRSLLLLVSAGLLVVESRRRRAARRLACRVPAK